MTCNLSGRIGTLIQLCCYFGAHPTDLHSEDDLNIALGVILKVLNISSDKVCNWFCLGDCVAKRACKNDVTVLFVFANTHPELKLGYTSGLHI